MGVLVVLRVCVMSVYPMTLPTLRLLLVMAMFGRMIGLLSFTSALLAEVCPLFRFRIASHSRKHTPRKETFPVPITSGLEVMPMLFNSPTVSKTCERVGERGG